MKDENEHIDTMADEQKVATDKKRKRRNRKAQKAVRGVVQGRSFLSWDFFKRNAVYIITVPATI